MAKLLQIRVCANCAKQPNRHAYSPASRHQSGNVLCWDCWNAGYHFKADGTIGHRTSLAAVIEDLRAAVSQFNRMWNDPAVVRARLTFLEGKQQSDKE